MKVVVRPKRLSGAVAAPSSKSALHRQLILAACADKPTRIVCRGLSEDILATAACLKALGARVARKDGALLVTPLSRGAEGAELDCGQSGSTARFMLPVAAAKTARFRLTGTGRLPLRPMGALCGALRQNGCAIDADALPMNVSGRLRAGVFSVPGFVSSQFVSGLLLALPGLDGDSDIRIEGSLSSPAYVEMTLKEAARFGLSIGRTPDGFRVPGGQTPRTPGALATEGDWSAAAVFLCADFMQRGGVCVTGTRDDSLQPDRAVLRILRDMARDGGLEIDVDPFPDLTVPLCAAACARASDTAFVNAARLKLKESDRLEALKAMVLALGGEAEADGARLVVHGRGRLGGGRVDACGDHRIAMAAAVASAICDGPVEIDGAEAVAKSYPDFWDDFISIGGDAHVV